MTAGRNSTIIARDATSVTVRVPMAFARRGGRKVIIAPDGSAGRPGAWTPQSRINNSLIKALARAFRWQCLLDSGEYGSLDELACSKKINRSYVSRVLRLTLLAPDIVEAILDGRQSEHITLAELMQPFPIEWERQKEMLHRMTTLTRPR